MNDTYLGWDGKPYPWPPPEGWYEASDGRYWAPGTGPTPAPPSGLGGSTPDASSQGPPPTETPYEASPPPQQVPSFDPGPPPEESSPTQAMHTAPSSGGFQPPPTDVLPSYGGPAPTPPGYGNGGGVGGPWSEEPASGGSNKILLIGLGVLAALALAAGVAYFATRGSGDDDAVAASGDTTAESSDSTTEATEAPPATDPTEGDGTENPDDTTDGSEETSTTLAEETSTSEEDTDTTTGDSSGQVEEFRSLLSDNSLASDQLSDAEIASFGDTFCSLASDAEDADEFSSVRQDAIDNSASDLDPDARGLVIDSAVVVFCPDEADRLGISV